MIIKIYHFHNGSGGGVMAVIRNLVKFSRNPAIQNHIIYTINKHEQPAYSVNNLEGAFSEKVFYYSPKWNFYHTCRKLSKLLPDEKSVIVCHDWLELGMISNLGLQNPVVFFLHGSYDYYYQLAQKHEPAIDQFICVAQNIETKLLTFIHHRKDNVVYLRFPVPRINSTKVLQQHCNIIFVGRLSIDKGYPLLPMIAAILCRQNINVMWHIAGTALTDTDTVVWDKKINVHFYGNLSNERLLELLKDMKILILPSLAEGMPVAVIEAMKAGVIPVVSDIDGGIQELVINNETGYKINGNQPEGYAEKIIELVTNHTLTETLKHNCIQKANLLFDPVENTVRIEEQFIKVFSTVKKKKKSKKIYGSTLDQPWIPNVITQSARSI